MKSWRLLSLLVLFALWAPSQLSSPAVARPSRKTRRAPTTTSPAAKQRWPVPATRRRNNLHLPRKPSHCADLSSQFPSAINSTQAR